MEKIYGYGRHSINDSDIAAVVSVLKGDTLTQGPAVSAFEHELSQYLGCERAVAVANGTAALHLAALALEIGPGDAVIVPGLTFAATANAVLYTGATPVFADISPQTWGLEISSIKRAFHLAKSKGLNPKAIFLVHFGGLPVDMPDLIDFARSEKLYIVEDACHALGAQYRTKTSGNHIMVGSGHLADLSIFSFHPVKHITTGEGGAITTNNLHLASKLERLRTHGITKDPLLFEEKSEAFDPVSGQANQWYMEMQDLGYNYRMCDIQAALGTSQLSRANAFMASRRQIADQYRKSIGNFRHITAQPGDHAYGVHGYHLFPTLIDFARIGKTRAEIIKKLFSLGIPTQVHYLPVYLHPYYRRHKNKWLMVDCPETEIIYRHTISIPMYQDLSINQVNYILNCMQDLVG